jgi:hypothetical protein
MERVKGIESSFSGFGNIFHLPAVSRLWSDLCCWLSGFEQFDFGGNETIPDTEPFDGDPQRLRSMSTTTTAALVS